MNDSNNVSYMWLAGILVSVVIVMGGAWATRTSSQVGNLQESKISSLERVSKLETRSDEVDKRLDRIEKKIDMLLERK